MLAASGIGSATSEVQAPQAVAAFPIRLQHAPKAPVQSITFAMKPEGQLEMPWRFEIHVDGPSKFYQQERPEQDKPAMEQSQEVTVTVKTMEALKAGLDRNSEPCETRRKKIAKTGTKSLTYWFGEAPFACEFNYSDDAGVMRTANAFEAMADTMEFGTRLARERRFDKLGLYAEMDALVEALKNGTAIEVQNIGPVLQTIADDEQVIKSVRLQAARLLLDARR